MGAIGRDLLNIDVRQIATTRGHGPTDVVRRAEYNELIWTIEGRAALTVCGRDVVLPASTLVLYPPHETMRFRAATPGALRAGFIYFAADLDLHEPIVRTFGRDLVGLLLDHLVWLEAATAPDWEARAEHVLRCLLTILLADGPREGAPALTDLPEPIARAVKYVVSEWSSPSRLRAFSLDELANAANVSPEHFTRLFRALCGTPPAAAFRLLRLQRAADLLQHTDLTVNQIAAYCGFSSEYHLSAAFKKATGSAPRRYGKQPLQPSILPARLRRLRSHLDTLASSEDRDLG